MTLTTDKGIMTSQNKLQEKFHPFGKSYKRLHLTDQCINVFISKQTTLKIG